MRWWLLLALTLVGVEGNVRFTPGVRYVYRYWGAQGLQKSSSIRVKAEVAITVTSQKDRSQICRLDVFKHRFTVHHEGKDYQPHTPHLNFSNCLHFEMSDSGEVTRVQYNNDSDVTVIMLQKTLLSVLSGRLMISHHQLRQGAPWEYKINETGNDGVHESKYEAKPDRGAIIFRKSRTKKTMETADEFFNKITYFNIAKQIPWKIIQKSHFTSPVRPASGFTAKDGLGTPISDSNKYGHVQNFDIPEMHTSGSVKLELLWSRPDTQDHPQCHRLDQKNDTLRQSKIPLPDVPLADITLHIDGNLTCIATAIARERRRDSSQCFHDLVNNLRRLSQSDLSRLLNKYIQYGTRDLRKRYLVEAMVVSGTHSALKVVTEEVLDKDIPDAEVVARVQLQLSDLSIKPPKKLLDVMEERAFIRPFRFKDPRDADLVNGRSILILGALVNKMAAWNPTWSKRVAKRLEDRLSVHDPIKHRVKRSALTEEHYYQYVDDKSVYLFGLGNAAADSSFHHLLSYGNSTEAPLLWKKGAIFAISRYNTEQAADSLLGIALTDPDHDVKSSALFEYEKHPFGAVVGPLHEAETNTSSVLHARTRRSLDRVLSAIWKGFHFKIQSPSVDWRKKAGGPAVGASVGILIKNLLDVKISPLSSHVVVDIHNKAWMTMHLGVVGLNVDMYRAEVCYRGHIRFDLNILKEYNFGSVLAYAKKFDRVVRRVHTSLITAAESFRNLVISVDQIDVNKIFQQLEQVIKDLPEKVLNFERIGKPLLKELARYAGMPPIIKRVEDFIMKARQLFKDIDNDITTLYNEVVDVVGVTLPWAWDEISQSFNDIIDAIRRILHNPKSAINDIGVSTTRITTAVLGILAAKERLDQANVFKKGNAPYWFDVKGVVAELRKDLQEIKSALNDTIDWLRSQPERNDNARRYTGLTEREMKTRAMQRILDILGSAFEEPLASVREIILPFLDVVDKFNEAVKNVKKAWVALRDGYEESRTLLESLFGLKMSKAFPRKYLESETCGKGFFESTGNGRYQNKGVDVKADIGAPVVAPFEGRVWPSGANQVTMKVTRMRHVIVVLDNVRIDQNATNQTVAAGQRIGTVAPPSGCSDGHIHFSMIKTKTRAYIDPSRYMERREMPPPRWIQECNYYWLTWKIIMVDRRQLAGPPGQRNRTPKIENAPDLSKIDLDRLKLKRRVGIIGQGPGYSSKALAEMLGIPDIREMDKVFNFRMSRLKMASILDFLEHERLPHVKAHTEDYLRKLVGLLEPKLWRRPDGMAERELRTALSVRNLDTTGSRSELLRRYRQSWQNCADFHAHLWQGMACDFDIQCQGFSCVADLNFLIYRQTALVYAKFDPCTRVVTIGANEWSHRVDLLTDNENAEGTVPLTTNLNLPQLAQLSLSYKLEILQEHVKVTMAVTWCNTKASECERQEVLVDGLELIMANCSTQSTGTQLAFQATQGEKYPILDKLANMTTEEIIKLAHEISEDPESIKTLVEELRKEYSKLLLDSIKKLMYKIFKSEFELSDFCTEVYGKQLGPFHRQFFEVGIDVPIMIFWIGFSFEGVGTYGVRLQCNLCLLSMKIEAVLRPYAEPQLFGALRVGIAFLTAELRTTGYVFDVSMPLKGELMFSRFPLDVAISLDIDLVPLRIKLHTLLIFEMDMVFFTIKKTLVDKNLWEYATPTLRQNIFSIHTREPEKSPPRFSSYSGSPCTACSGDAFTSDLKGLQHAHESQAFSMDTVPTMTESGPCKVSQVRDRDHTDPAFNIEFAVDSDRSEVDLDYCVGIVKGGCDQVNNQPLGGPSTLIAKRMISGMPLYFTVCATNSAGLRTCTMASIPTYDTTLPSGRVMPDFSTTSHPNILRGSALVIDDSNISTVLMSAGYGRGPAADQVVSWQPITVEGDKGVDTGDDPHGLRVLEKFSAPRRGRLVSQPYKNTVYVMVQHCAADCLSFPTTRCRGFNYEHKPDGGKCELMHEVESHEVERHKVGSFMYYERYGIGHKSSFNFTQLLLDHNNLYFYNYFLVNVIGYQNILPSIGVLADFTTPRPGFIANETMDDLKQEACEDFVPYKYKMRCDDETPLPNFRLIHDGPGSNTVFNGHKSGVHERYTRANKSMSGNWDGFNDPQTGILVYMWSIGREVCGQSVHQLTDPHDHLPGETQWNHQGLAHPLTLKDGDYYITVQAMNKIEFGGPMAVTVCHTTPYTVDTTPPEFYYLDDVTYDSSNESITFIYNATDLHSGIKRTEFGLGRSRRDTALLSWKDAPPGSPMTYYYKVPDGVPAWVKVRVTNNVDLRTSKHADRPILVDTTPPIAGVVYDGENVHQGDLMYQSSSTRLCASWTGFYDPESGIHNYLVGAGTSPYNDDVASFEFVDRTVTHRCWTVRLQHNMSYYSTVTAYHNGHDNLNVTATSSGVLVDTTVPNKGTVHDGKPGDPDVVFSSNAAGADTHWRGFTDPESGLNKYRVGFWRKHYGDRTGDEIHLDEVAPNITSWSVHHLHLHHRDNVHVVVTATNGANSSTASRSTGFSLDLTEPRMYALSDGSDPAKNAMYTASTTELSATWNFTDPESGLALYAVTAYQTKARTRSKIFPSRTQSRDLPGDTTAFTTDETLNLEPGLHYSFRVAAVNRAKLTSVHQTDGVTVDNTPPEMMYVHAGSINGESEELEDGYVIHNELEGLWASWRGFDPESGVETYLVAIGTRPGSDDTMRFTNMDDSLNRYMKGLRMSLTDPDTNIPVYYVTVKCINGAGVESSLISSSPVKIVEGDKTGLVEDGPAVGQDIDYQTDITTITASFHGFSSVRDGIAHYLWGVGTAPLIDDVMPFVMRGIVVEDNSVTDERSRYYHAQAILPLSDGTKYFSTIRAVTGAGNVLETSSNGVTVDRTPPDVRFTQVGPEDHNVTEDVIYQREPAAISASWNITDEESGVNMTSASMSDVPGKDLSGAMLSSLPPTGSLPNAAFQPSPDGQTNIVTLQSMNQAGLDSREDSQAVVVDETPPIDGHVECPKFIAAERPMTCHWSGYLDRESRITSYKVGMGLYVGDDSIVTFIDVPATIQHHTFTGLDKLGLEHGKRYTITVMATNMAGRSSPGNAAEVVIDDTPPQGGIVIELPSTSDWNFGNESIPEPCEGRTACQKLDVVCQRSVTQMSAAFEPFQDPESGIIGYEISIGSTPGGSQLKEFTAVPEGMYNVTLTDLDLSRTRQAFVTIKGYNGAGQYSAVTSNGVYISRISAGLVSIEESNVIDGDTPGRDQDYQSFSDSLSAQWDLRGDPCPVRQLQWSIRRVGGHVVLPYTDLPVDTRKGTIDELQLVDGETFFTIVRVTNLLGHTYGLQSDGITVQVEPLMPGVVRDGPIFGFSITSQPSLTVLSANWDGFGSDTGGPRPIPPPDDMEAETGNHQDIEHYEIAAGNDRRYPGTRENVHPFVNVGLNKTWTFENLKLQPKSTTYYMTVRAYSVSTAMAEITSNGIRVGVGDSVITMGEVNVKPYISSETEVEITWKNFRFIYPTMFYRWGIGTYNPDIYNISCKELLSAGVTGNHSQLYDVHELTTTVGNTYIKVTGLSMSHNKRYHVAVLAVDQSGECMMSATDFLVDVTPPVTGTLSVGHDFGNSVVFVPNPSTVMITWSGYHDPESDVSKYEVALVNGSGCSPPDPNAEEITYTTVNKNITSLRAMDFELMPKTPYFVILRTTNGAETSITTISKPVLLDPTPPAPGTVIDGSDIMYDRKFQNSLTDVKGSLLYLPSPTADACPYRRYSMAGPDRAWRGVQTKSMNGMIDRNVTFQHRRVKYSNDSGVSLELRRDVSSPSMLSSSLYTAAHVGTGGRFQFELQAAEGVLRAVTSVCFRDGPEGEVWDYMGNASTPEAARRDDSGTVIPDGISGDTATKPDFTWSMLRGFGVQLKPNATTEERSQLIVWANSGNSTVTTSTVDLDFDPADKVYRYELVINENMPNPIQDDYSITVRIDGRVRALLTGLPTLSDDALFQVQVWNDNAFLTPLDDAFNAPRTSAMLKNVEMPPYSDEPCRYAESFRGGQSPVEAVYAGIGTTPLGTDQEPFRKVYFPCLPCGQPCMECNRDCIDSSIRNIGIHLTGLSLPEPEPISNSTGNSTSLQVYYLTVKMVTGSGQETIASSNGFYIDITPPEVTTMVHTDVLWSPQQPVTHQGSNDTIMVVWMAEDKESEVETSCQIITEYQWAIGTQPGTEDIQNYTSVGTNTVGYNAELGGILQDNNTYYVTLKVVNQAGLVSTVVSDGVTVLLSVPDESNTRTGVVGTEPVSLLLETRKSSSQKVLRTSTQDGITVNWAQPTSDAIDAIFFSLSSDSHLKEDIFPQRQVGYNNSGILEVSEDGFFLYGRRMANVSDIRDNSRPYPGLDNTEFFMEPGRTIYIWLEACTKAHKCGYLDNKIVMILRNSDKTTTAAPGQRVEGLLGLAGDKMGKITFKSSQAQTEKTTLAYGQLSMDDLKQSYTSAASNTFKPFISNPELSANKTDRMLYKRIRSFGDISFFMTTLPGQPVTGAVEITYPYNPSVYTEKFMPLLLTWNTEAGVWTDARNTCPDSEQNMRMQNSTVTVKVCGLNPKKKSRTKRSTGNQVLVGTHQFITAQVRKEFANSPPVLRSSNWYTMLEDSGTLLVYLQASDPENDTVVFSIDTTHLLPLRGSANVSTNGRLTYRPCRYCSGSEVVRIKLTEDRSDSIPALTSVVDITVEVVGINHSPALFNPFLMIETTGEDSNVQLTMEQRRENLGVYSTLNFITGAVDINPNDTLHIDYHQEGLFVMSIQSDLRNHDRNNCLVNATEKIKEYMNTMVRRPNATAVFPVPCDMVQGIPVTRLSVTSQVVTLRPPDMFFGSIQIQAVGADQTGGRSDIMTITVYVLENRCVNNGVCRGPPEDPDCTGIQRANGFQGYTCACPAGLDGQYCQINIDECASSPCQQECTCVDGINSYSCFCPAGNNRWWFAFFLFLPLAFILSGFVGYRLIQRKKLKNKVMPIGVNDQDVDYDVTRSSQNENPEPERLNRDLSSLKQKVGRLRAGNRVSPLYEPEYVNYATMARATGGVRGHPGETNDGIEIRSLSSRNIKAGDRVIPDIKF